MHCCGAVAVDPATRSFWSIAARPVYHGQMRAAPLYQCTYEAEERLVDWLCAVAVLTTLHKFCCDPAPLISPVASGEA